MRARVVSQDRSAGLTNVYTGVQVGKGRERNSFRQLTP